MKKTYLEFDDNDSVFNNQLRMQVYSATFSQLWDEVVPWQWNREYVNKRDFVHVLAMKRANEAVEANAHARLLAHMPSDIPDDQEPPLL